MVISVGYRAPVALISFLPIITLSKVEKNPAPAAERATVPCWPAGVRGRAVTLNRVVRAACRHESPIQELTHSLLILGEVSGRRQTATVTNQEHLLS
jgi:hypothetical protein